MITAKTALILTWNSPIVYHTLIKVLINCTFFGAGRWFSPGTPVSSTNKTDGHDITEILLKVELNTIILTLPLTLYLR
jgi:hypothetical protein